MDADNGAEDGSGDAPPGTNEIGWIPEDEDTPDEFSSGAYEENTEFSANSYDYQLEGP